MGKVVKISDRRRSRRGRARRLEDLKRELLQFHGIDLDQLLSSEPATTLTIEEFEELTERILECIDAFCEHHPQVTIHDVLYTLENVRDIIRDNVGYDGQE